MSDPEFMVRHALWDKKTIPCKLHHYWIGGELTPCPECDNSGKLGVDSSLTVLENAFLDCALDNMQTSALEFIERVAVRAGLLASQYTTTQKDSKVL